MAHAVYNQAAAEGMRHADHTVAAFHGQIAERPHDITPQRRQLPVNDLAPNAGQVDPTAVRGKQAVAGADAVTFDRQLRQHKLPGTLRRQHLHKGAAFGPPGNKVDHVILTLMLIVPARKAPIPHGCPSWRGC